MINLSTERGFNLSISIIRLGDDCRSKIPEFSPRVYDTACTLSEISGKLADQRGRLIGTALILPKGFACQSLWDFHTVATEHRRAMLLLCHFPLAPRSGLARFLTNRQLLLLKSLLLILQH